MIKIKQKSIILLTCEHASNRVPQKYAHLFSKNPHLLNTHRGYDIGAREVAKYLAKRLSCTLISGEYSRLLVELNRSPHHQNIFSSLSFKLSKEEKKELIQKIYEPYRAQVVSQIQKYIQQKKRIYHLSIHSFTPKLNGQVRQADIAFLYSTQRPYERDYSYAFKKELLKIDPKLKVRMNYPYKGDSDGLTKTLRQQFPEEKYLGVEIEMNQKYFTSHPKTYDLKKYLWQAIEGLHSLS